MKTANYMANLETSTHTITELVEVLKDISDKINMLGLNATIEAARAGEIGRGFTVVAEEIQKLAHSSHAEIAHITETLSEIARHTKMASGLSKESVAIINKANSISSIIADILADQTAVISNIASESVNAG